jgi:hypothetical protein
MVAVEALNTDTFPVVACMVVIVPVVDCRVGMVPEVACKVIKDPDDVFNTDVFVVFAFKLLMVAVEALSIDVFVVVA